MWLKLVSNGNKPLVQGVKGALGLELKKTGGLCCQKNYLEQPCEEEHDLSHPLKNMIGLIQNPLQHDVLHGTIISAIWFQA